MKGGGQQPAMRFRHHYTVAEARGLLPDIGRWLDEVRLLNQSVSRLEERLAELRHDFGDQGGHRVDAWTRGVVRLRQVLHEFKRRDLLIEDLDRGLVGFPSILAGREVLLSWEEGDEDVGHWKEIGD